VAQDFSTVDGLAPGDQIAGYQVAEVIGRGGMAVVYRALDLRLGRHVALKVLAPHLGEDEAFRQRFIRESRAAAGVDHPNIIPVFEAGSAGDLLFIAMRYVSGGDVRALIETEGTLSLRRATTITAQVASALDTAHAHGLVHRDVKPGNMLLGGTGDSGIDHVYLSDFGLSKSSLATSTLTAAGQFMGTLDYVSPEQIQGQPADGRADQYALACTAVEMLTGTPPFNRDESMALLWAQLEEPPPSLTQRRPDLPPSLDAVIRTALAKSPRDRYPSCLAFASALRAAGDGRPATIRVREATAPAELPQAGQPVPQFGGKTAETHADPVPAMVVPKPETTPVVMPERSPARQTPVERPRPAPARQTKPWFREDHLVPQRPSARRRGNGGRVIAGLLGVVVLAALGVVGYKFFYHPAKHGSPPVAAATTTPAATAALTPQQVVQDYFNAINQHNYRQAWALVGETKSYAAFRDGFQGTANDILNIVSVTGNVVTAKLEAQQTNGTVQDYAGTYTVSGGIISQSDVHCVSGCPKS
jgi:serine/threonine-protein kinase